MKRRSVPWTRRASLVLMTMGLLLAVARPARAFPVFARKYQTSCTTCHTIFPKLNPFGQAFRLNGYRLPKETEAQVKQTPVSMGSEAYKRVWPRAVWPSELPGNAPVALNIKMAVPYASSVDGDGNKTIVHADLQFPQEVNMFAAGTMGDHMSFMAELTHGENPDGSGGIEIEHARLDFDSILGPDHLVNVRIGKFAPNLYDGFQEMWLMTNNGVDALFAYNPVGFNGGTGLDEEQGLISLPARVRGVEIYGVAAHRFFYTLGVATKIGPGGRDSAGQPNGNFNNNSHKDFYARIDYKFGGMGLDGDTQGVNLPPENWRENSFRIGLLALSGNGTGIDNPVTDPSGELVDPTTGSATDADGHPIVFHMQDTQYTRTGIFASWMFGDLNLFGVILHGTDKLQLRDSGNTLVLNETSRDFSAWFVQADYVILPPLQASFRYERLTPADSSIKPLRFMNVNLSYLLAANVKAMLEYHKDLNESQNFDVAAVLRVAF
ncbi:MAG: hypothetical protein KGN80_06575 [Acidobacteriota bacterium]|nr:hypothetical protein [Acidobacteriota bacterium]